ncbi:MAG: DEAD/DEAH box helicase, partial [Bifidobacterium merycicum]|nr:DEAD/DEAH box helicase [Bifidobacterium merycicum]
MSRHHQQRSDDANVSPSERYAVFRQRQRRDASIAAQFERTLPFELDSFQSEANQALEQGNNVLVAAPTGAGKTVVADFAVFLAQQHNVKAFYTTPIKALSNQKYHDLVDVYGEDKVGLLTGDISINSEADIVVMTTEVLRNMLYEHSTTLSALRYVFIDEVHYLADRFRGPVWEEVIIHLPQRVRIVALSATVSNVEDFGDWISSVRGDTKLIVSEKRSKDNGKHHRGEHRLQKRPDNSQIGTSVFQ